MSILNLTNDGLPSVLVALVRTLESLGSMKSSKLIDLCAPITLFGAVESRNQKDKQQIQAKQTLKRWVQMGLFEQQGVQIRFAKKYTKKSNIGSTDTLRNELLRIILDKGNNSGYLEKEPAKAGDFTYTITWILMQDIYVLSDSWEVIEPLMLRQINHDCAKPLQNNTRWTGFKAWASFLGIGLPVNGITIDMTEPVYRALTELLPPKKEMAISDAVDGIGSVLPVLDRGVYWKQVRAQFRNNEYLIGDNQLSNALSAALLRLKYENQIDLILYDDARSMEITGRKFNNIKRVSHITRRRS